MGKVGRPSNHIPVKYVEYKKEDGTVEAYILVNTKLIKLTPDNLQNPYEKPTNDEEKEKNERPPPLNEASIGYLSLDGSQIEDGVIDYKESTDPAEIPFEPDEYNETNLGCETLSDSYFEPNFQVHLFEDENSNDEANNETTNDLAKNKSELIPDLLDSNESYNPFQIYF
ncbi:hypothetical protein M9Y10_024952 [Tritrichomonas musculus]|uniref:Uncharacterized protein n=1 Tax=Tritrichomonas musculus TaxID=1915356 RepID=A0ABR2HBP0_9EUKA